MHDFTAYSTQTAATLPTTHQPRAGRRQWLALAVLMLPVLLVSIDNTVLSFALPSISADLRPGSTQLLWIVDVYALMLAGLLLAMGAVGDRIGRRRLLLVGAVGFAASSLLASRATDPNMLIAARALLGISGATLMPSTLSLLRNIFTSARDRRIAIATWAAMFSGGAAFGPIVGGWLLEHFTWHAVFLINVPLVVLLVPLAWVFVPESRNTEAARLDPASIVTSMLAMAPLVLAIKHAATTGLDSVTVAAVLVGAASVWLFIRRQQRLTQPMLDLTFFRNRVFTGAVVANLLSMVGYAGFLFFAAQLLQLVLGLSPMDAALVLVPGLLTTVTCGFVAVRLVRRFPVRLLVAGSFAAAALGYAWAAFTGHPSVASVAVAFVLMGVGIGLAETLTNDLVLAAVPTDRAGVASAISETAYEVGAVLGTAVLGSILSAVYRLQLQVPADFDGVRPRNFDTLGSTLDFATANGGAAATQLAASAKEAFDQGVQVTSAAAIVVALLAALVSWRNLPR